MKHLLTLSILLTGIILVSCTHSGKKKEDPATGTVDRSVPAMNKLSDEEIADGWALLFDGHSTQGWKSWLEDSVSGWIVEDGCLVGLGLGGDIGGDIVTEKEYENFILTWEWKLGPHGNSGVSYHVVEDPKYNAGYETGPEYQLIEDGDFRDQEGNPYPLEKWQETAADYAMYVTTEDKILHLRDWNSSKIVFSPEKVEYWLNGKKEVEFVPWSEDWYERRNSGKWDQYPDYGLAKKGKILLQDHGSKVWFRNIRIKEL